jgi:hypothetical protein
VVISPLQWADSTAKHIAEKVERGLVEGAEDAQGTKYPNLEAARRREETYDFWTEMISKGFNKCRWGGRNREEASSAPPHPETEDAPEQEGHELEPLKKKNSE